jgi:hypothetical protein
MPILAALVLLAVWRRGTASVLCTAIGCRRDLGLGRSKAPGALGRSPSARAAAHGREVRGFIEAAEPVRRADSESQST